MQLELPRQRTNGEPRGQSSRAPCLVWADLTGGAPASGLFADLARVYRAMRMSEWSAVASAVRAAMPLVLCVEFDRPQPSDLEPLGELTRSDPTVPVLMLTARHSPELVMQALRVRVWDYLVKPVAVPELDGRITTLLEQSDAARERAHAAIRLPAQPPAGRRDQRTAPAIALIAVNFHERIDLAAAARACHLSPSHFSRVFKREHGVTFSHYVVQYRIRRACDLLAAPGVSVKEVGFGVGFNDLAYFSRTFRRCVGVCPTQYQSGAPVQ
jgi:AraC-like DNA-binding protein